MSLASSRRVRATTLAVATLAMSLSSCSRSRTAGAPVDGSPALALDGAVSSKLLKKGVSTQLAARVVYEARPLDRKERPPVNLALLVDTSGSMDGKPLEDARAASLALLNSLQASDRLAVVVFNSKAETLLPSTAIEDVDLDDVRKKLRSMRAHGTTDMSGGLTAAIEEVSRALSSDGINRVLLLGDGVPNEGAAIPALAQNAAGRGISITSLGLGADYDETLMGKIAQTSGGRFHYVSDSSKVAAFFREEIVRLQKVYAKNATLVLTPGPGVTIDEVVGQETSRDGKIVRVNLGDISLGDKREIVVRLTTTPGLHDGAPLELMDAELRFTPASGRGSSDKSAFFGAHVSTDDAKIAASRDEEVIRAAVRAQAAADTLEQIRRSRESDKPRPTPQAAPAALPAPQAAQPAKMPAAQRMKMHDDAMQTLQAVH
jgi:Ca-activated chloride channel family protein